MKIKLMTRFLTGGLCLSAATAFAQTTTASTPVTETGLAGFFVGLAQNYPWLATILLIVGALRVVFKPLMTLLDGYVKENCSAEEYARLRTFEAGPVYKWVSFAMDLVGSVKLPVIGVKPASAQVDQTKTN